MLWLHRFDMLFVMQTLGGSFLAFCSHFGHHNHKTVGKNTKKVKFREDLSRFEIIILVKTIIHKLSIVIFFHFLAHGSIHKWCLCYVTWEKLIFNDLSKLMLLLGWSRLLPLNVEWFFNANLFSFYNWIHTLLYIPVYKMLKSFIKLQIPPILLKIFFEETIIEKSLIFALMIEMNLLKTVFFFGCTIFPIFLNSLC